MPAAGESADGADRQSVEIDVAGPDDLGAEFFRFELATAVAGAILERQPLRPAERRRGEGEDAVHPRFRTCPGDSPSDRSRRDGRGAARRRSAGRLRRDPGVHRSGTRARARASRRAGSRDRLRRHGRPRPALPPLHRPAAQGRAADRPFHPGRRRRRARRRHPQAEVRLPAPHRGSGCGRLRGTEGARASRRSRQTGGPMNLGMVGLGRMGGNMTERLRAGRPHGRDVRAHGSRAHGGLARRARRHARSSRASCG